ncbi:beta-ig-h3 fasciclin [Moniliophthora roreri MCA 2997]|uniref:Beta-ig-h3 fasciclin n=1 Tax=Moniliophthora roreri (strain MCA 2997) TaxID=1381753 RepID=V2XQJ0_MONRO|nr:beta-ig-h3 fasciclin [Moniliophthora roreri MCA 2997]
MHVLRKFGLFAIASGLLVHAQPYPVLDDAIINEINAIGLTTFASLFPAILGTKTGFSLTNRLTIGTNSSLFIPSNDAFKELSLDTMDDELAAKIISYHIVQGNYYCNDTKNILAEDLPKTTIARTLLDDPDYVQLQKNLSQVLIWGRNKEVNGKPVVELLHQPSTTTVLASHLVQGYAIFVIDHVLTIPPKLSSVLDTPETSKLKDIVGSSKFHTTTPDRKSIRILEFFDGRDYLHGFTLFAPNNAAFDQLGQQFSELSPENVTLLLLNHAINRETLYSTDFAKSIYPSISGQATQFISNSSGTFVVSGEVTAKILSTDRLVKNGVMHLIDTVLTDFSQPPLKAAGEGGFCDDACDDFF